MKRIDEDIIERHIRFPDMLDERVQVRVEHEVASSVFAKAVANFYREFYEELDVLGNESSPAVDAFLKRLFP